MYIQHHVLSGMVNTETGGQLQLTGRDAKDNNSNNIDHQAEGKQSANESKDHHHHHHHHLGPSNNSNNNVENEFLESGDEGLAGAVYMYTQLIQHFAVLYVCIATVYIHCLSHFTLLLYT